MQQPDLVTYVSFSIRRSTRYTVAQMTAHLTYCRQPSAALRVRPKRTIRPGPTRVLKFSEMRPLQGLQMQTTMRSRIVTPQD